MKETATSNLTELSKVQRSFLRTIALDSQFHRVLDNLPDLHFYAKDRSGRILFCSRFLHLHLGFRSMSDILGKTDRDLTPGPMAESYLAGDAKIYATLCPIDREMVIWMDHVGLPELFESHKYPIFDNQKNVIGIMGILRETGKLTSAHSIEPKLAAAVDMLQSSLSDFPELAVQASASHLSIRQYQRIFQKEMGSSPYRYWMKLRIREACYRIRRHRDSLAVIAFDLGFADQSSFTQQFRAQTSRTPGQYKRMYSENIQ